jgi:hypothetical protein
MRWSLQCRRNFNMNNRTEKIIGALDQLCDALNLGRSESATEYLFLILAMAFNETNAKEVEKIRHQDEGLTMDVRGELAEKIEEAFSTYEAHDANRFKGD